MKKDLEWLKEEINNMKLKGQSIRPKKINNKLDVVLGLIDQLDEPEVLSQEWIDKNKEPFHHFETNKVDYYVSADFLQNLLVPKQELPVIPQFVADWYESEGKRSSWWNWFYKWGWDESRTELEKKTIRWMQDYNEEKFVDIFRYGYEVEEEQKYILSINITDKASKTNYETFLNKRGIFHSMDNESFNSEEFNWSEEEIKDLENGEILFEHFAAKVEELEE